ncbi:hypothetical protein M9Y10_012632 [Tritrichomonas musculus]|uniref:Uncharacterized protein n=1 Tax=Tritrichomonas musculus TaxID=1915356 RepID=A0ABR2IF27_9EUKA
MSDYSESNPLDYLGNPVYEVDYLNTLNTVTSTLSPNDAADYFDKTLSHFEEGSYIDKKTATTILRSVRKLIRDDQIYQAFKTDGFSKLPFGSYSNEVYPILYDLVQRHPDVFNQQDDQIGNKLLKSFVDDPKKGLSITAKAAQKYVNDPTLYLWSILDVIKNRQAISCIKNDPELLSTLLSIVVYLCQNSDEYRNERLVEWFSIIDDELLSEQSKDEQYLRQVYISLCYLRDEARKFNKKKQLQLKLPINKMIIHLNYDHVQGPILALLVDRAELNPDELNNKKLIRTLFTVAENKNLKSTIVLMKLATSDNLVREVFGNGDWLLKELPETVDTIRLFLVAFEHVEMRDEISRNQNFIPFLKTIIKKLNSSGVITIVCTVIRRIQLDQAYVKSMSDQGLVSTFIQTAKSTDDETKVSSHSLLLFLNTVAEHSYLDEYVSMTKFVSDKVKTDKSLSEIASYVAVTFAQYSNCRQKFRELHLDDFFETQKGNKKSKRLAKNAEKFLDRMNSE